MQRKAVKRTFLVRYLFTHTKKRRVILPRLVNLEARVKIIENDSLKYAKLYLVREQADLRETLAARLQHLPAEQIKQAVLKWLDDTKDASLALLEQNLPPTHESDLAQEELSPALKAAAFKAWAESHSCGLPLLSDEAISRESIYSDERL